MGLEFGGPLASCTVCIDATLLDGLHRPLDSELKASKNIDTGATGKELIGIGDADRVLAADRLLILWI